MAGRAAWDRDETVAGFANAQPNETLLRYASSVSVPGVRTADIGCGAGRNAVPLAAQGWHVVGLDTSPAMLEAAQRRASDAGCRHVVLCQARMHTLPLIGQSCHLMVAHGIWNLAQSDAEFRTAIREAARVAAPGARLFIFTFSRTTLPPGAAPVSGESFVFTQFSGERQCFLTGEQLVTELADAGFMPDDALPLRELNAPPRKLLASSGPVILEGGFVRD